MGWYGRVAAAGWGCTIWQVRLRPRSRPPRSLTKPPCHIAPLSSVRRCTRRTVVYDRSEIAKVTGIAMPETPRGWKIIDVQSILRTTRSSFTTLACPIQMRSTHSGLQPARRGSRSISALNRSLEDASLYGP